METQQDDECHTIHSFPRRENEEIRSSIRKFKNRYYADLRIWFQDEKSDEMHPTKKGICFGFQHIPQIMEGMKQLAREAEHYKNGSTGGKARV